MSGLNHADAGTGLQDTGLPGPEVPLGPSRAAPTNSESSDPTRTVRVTDEQLALLQAECALGGWDAVHESLSQIRGGNPRTERDVQEELDRVEALCEAALGDYEVPCWDYNVPPGFVLSIVIPVFNEHETIKAIVARVRSLPIATQIIVVDDASRDGTTQVLRRLELLPNVEVVFKTVNEGKGAALRTGFERARGDVVAVQDADLEYDPRDLLRLLEPILANQCDVVYGSRFAESGAVGSSSVHRVGNQALTWLSNAVTGLKLTDMETCYKVFRRELLQEMRLHQNRFGFEPEFTAKLARQGARFQELPVTYAARDWDEGKKIGIRDGINAIYCILRYAWRD
ncbi:MAG: glycosyltransferase family 2 protein [Planctomycetales bacterium]|nr:glycosyltransferase family 2 protein [Planctomycetales bacterium]